jgi:hypothetical protein
MTKVDDKALAALKDMTLIVVGFYFGAAKAAGESQEKDKTEKKNNSGKPKDKTTVSESADHPKDQQAGGPGGVTK